MGEYPPSVSVAGAISIPRAVKIPKPLNGMCLLVKDDERHINLEESDHFLWRASADIPTGRDVEFNLVKFFPFEVLFDLNDSVHSLFVDAFNFPKHNVGAAIDNLLDSKFSIDKALRI